MALRQQVLTGAQQLKPETIRDLYPDRVSDPTEVDEILERVVADRVPLTSGLNRAIEPERAYVECVTAVDMSLEILGFETRAGEIFFNFELDGRKFFVATELLAQGEESNGWTPVTVGRPTEVFLKERRGRLRSPGRANDGAGWRVRIIGLDEPDRAADATVVDLSETGIGLSVSGSLAIQPGTGFSLQFLSGRMTGEQRLADVRHSSANSGWTRIGAKLHSPGFSGAIPVHRADEILPASRATSAARRARLLASSVRFAAERAARRVGFARSVTPEPEVARFNDSAGHEIVGLVDRVAGDGPPTAVIIPPAWGRTKETLLPLAKVMVATFEAAGRALVVLRFDGVRKRGESFNDPESETNGSHQGFTISQGIRDIQAAEEFIRTTFSPAKIVLVTFSAAGIDARAALARDREGRLGGWVCVVGPSDLQSAMSVISGGVDYVGGGERGVRFGRREVLGVEMDIDLANDDAAQHGLAFLEDSCRDFDVIDVPITWIHGAHDAWMDLDRVRHALSHGRQDNRKLVVIPTGHQLRTSREALDAFQFIAEEVAQMGVGERLEGRLPDLGDVAAARAAERARRPAQRFEPRDFWQQYLLGRDGNKGMDLMLESPSYLAMVRRQVALLDLKGGETVLDLGCGTGVLVSELVRSDPDTGLRVVGLDLVRGALTRFANAAPAAGGVAAFAVEANLSLKGVGLPVADASVDVIVGSLLLSYVEDPEVLLAAALRALKPGGRLLISSLRKDADFSKIWTHDERILKDRARAAGTVGGEERLTRSLQSFLNDAARVLDLEESGVFQFWEPDEFSALVTCAGFADVHSERALGDPPQAVIVAARR